MKELNVKQLPDNFFTAIGKEWMLVTSGDKEHFNTMTASWGCVGWLWNKPVAVIFIRPERYTHEFIEQNETLTLSFLGHEEEMRKAYNICGSRSGRNTDKMALTGLKASPPHPGMSQAIQKSHVARFLPGFQHQPMVW